MQLSYIFAGVLLALLAVPTEQGGLEQALRRSNKKSLRSGFSASGETPKFKAGEKVSQVMELADGNLLVNMDMIMSKSQYNDAYNNTEEHKSKRTVAIRGDNYRWTNGVIPYNTDGSINGEDERKWFKMLDFFHAESCIQFRARQGDYNYLMVVSKPKWGCMSAVGMQGGKQTLYLEQNGCRSQGTIFHETMHALGIYHEQERPDRNKHVYVEKSNMIHPDNYRNFEELSTHEAQTYGLPYDFSSLMHYDFDQFGRQKTGFPNYTYLQTIFPLTEKNGDKYTADQQNRGPSFLDLKLLNKMYNCEAKCYGRKPWCPSPGFINKDCQCMTPSIFFSRYCKGTEEHGWCYKYRIEGDNGDM